MAGYFVNVPGVRVPFHRDGTLAKKSGTTGSGAWTISGWSPMSSSELIELNDGDTTGYTLFSSGGSSLGFGGILSLVFPQPINIVGHNCMIYNASTSSVWQMWYSLDTSDGTDGTWTIANPDISAGTTPSDFRSFSSVNIANVVGLRFGGYNNTGSAGGNVLILRDLQIYAQWVPATLAAWHPTLDQQADGHLLDFGDTVLGQIYTKTFRIKNGRSLHAQDVVIGCTTGTAEFITGLAFSLDNITFSSTVTIPSILAGAISPTVYVKRTVNAGQSANIHSMAPIDFIATAWT